eukprot:NODE_1212_length_1519_cov_13.561224_g1007_i0.p1 GENE.NODE_1212_length_1519_cov_13.561224_g1007_i0~~NODE_1212_length_1519_cov_13.561224_g1007_i0.p1  ORF type:complete len:343 (+),score=16.26 NODE_1212_length_1519_cov_13.561224_g1007_i0:73-1101(+)
MPRQRSVSRAMSVEPSRGSLPPSTFGTTPRFTDKAMAEPGPADYDNGSSAFRSGVSIPRAGGRRNIGGVGGAIPGPGDYDTFRSSFTPKGVSRFSSAGLRSGTTSHSAVGGPTVSTPGPGFYEEAREGLSHRGGIIPRTGRSKSEARNTPGPADYDKPTEFDATHPSQPRVPFTRASRFGVSSRARSQTPGPLDYSTENYNRAFTSKGGIMPRAGSQARAEASRRTPGPGDYDTGKSSFSKGVTIPHAGSRAARTRIGGDKFGPGPSDYGDSVYSSFDAKRGTIPRSGRYGGAGVSRVGGGKGGSTPGPGDYDTGDSTLKKGPVSCVLVPTSRHCDLLFSEF